MKQPFRNVRRKWIRRERGERVKELFARRPLYLCLFFGARKTNPSLTRLLSSVSRDEAFHRDIRAFIPRNMFLHSSKLEFFCRFLLFFPPFCHTAVFLSTGLKGFAVLVPQLTDFVSLNNLSGNLARELSSRSSPDRSAAELPAPTRSPVLVNGIHLKETPCLKSQNNNPSSPRQPQRAPEFGTGPAQVWASCGPSPVTLWAPY